MRRVRGNAVRDRDLLAQVLVQFRQGRRTEDDLSGPPGRVARQERRYDVGAIALHQERHLLTVHFQIVVGRPGEGTDILVVFQHGQRDLRNVPPAGPHGIQGVAPVPTVKCRGRDQRVQAATEGQCGDDESHGQDRAQESGAHRNRGPTLTRFERHANANHGRSGEPAARDGGHNARPRRGTEPGSAPDPVRRGGEGQDDRDQAEDGDEHERAETEHRPVP